MANCIVGRRCGDERLARGGLELGLTPGEIIDVFELVPTGMGLANYLAHGIKVELHGSGGILGGAE